MRKRALVLAGGGSRGSYQVGVWRALRELEWDFDIVTGTSVGALNGALVVQGDYDAAVQMWQSISTTDVLNMQIDDKIDGLRDFNSKLALFLSEMAKNGGADPRPLEEILRRCVDEERIRNSPLDFAIVTVEYPSLTPRIISKDTLPPGELVDYLMASAACFPAMKMREIGGAKYIDGGYYDNMPVNLAMERGAEEIVAVDLEAIGRQKAVHAKSGVKLRYIRSRWDLGVFLLFDQEVAVRNMQLGYLDGLKEFGKLEGEAYAFRPGEVVENARELGRYFDLITIKLGITVQPCHRARLQPDPNAALCLARAVRSGARVRMTTPAGITAAAETAARIFALPPLEVYTFEQFNTALRSEADQLHTVDLEQLRIDLEELRRPKELLALLEGIDRRHVTAFLLSELRKGYERGDESPLMRVIGRLAADEFIAALYLLALEMSGRPQEPDLPPPTE